MNKVVKFSKEEDEVLAENVSKYSALYNPQNPDNKDLNIKESCWAEVSKSVGRSGKQIDIKKVNTVR